MRITYSMLVFISLCSINCTLSVRPARIFASSFSIFSICTSEASFCVVVTYLAVSISSLIHCQILILESTHLLCLFKLFFCSSYAVL